jgi:acyl transferase domain-containing protein
VLFAADEGPDAALIHDAEFTQPALFAVEVALLRLWQSWGVVPAAVAGRSVERSRRLMWRAYWISRTRRGWWWHGAG